MFSSFERSSPGMFVFTHFGLAFACGLTKTVTETSAQYGKEVWMEVINKIMGRPQED